MVDKYWLGWSDAFIEDIQEETPENFTDEYRESVANFFKKMIQEHNHNQEEHISDEISRNIRNINSLSLKQILSLNQKKALLQVADTLAKINCGKII